MAEREEELNSLLMKVKEESENDDLKPNIQKMKIMASSTYLRLLIFLPAILIPTCAYIKVNTSQIKFLIFLPIVFFN